MREIMRENLIRWMKEILDDLSPEDEKLVRETYTPELDKAIRQSYQDGLEDGRKAQIESN